MCTYKRIVYGGCYHCHWGDLVVPCTTEVCFAAGESDEQCMWIGSHGLHTAKVERQCKDCQKKKATTARLILEARALIESSHERLGRWLPSSPDALEPLDVDETPSEMKKADAPPDKAAKDPGSSDLSPASAEVSSTRSYFLGMNTRLRGKYPKVVSLTVQQTESEEFEPICVIPKWRTRHYAPVLVDKKPDKASK